MTSLNKPTSKPLRVAKMSVKPIWRKKLNPCNTSNELNVNSPTPMPKPLTPHHESSQKNNHPNQALPNPYIKDTPTSPQVVSHPPSLISPINSHVTYTQAPPQRTESRLRPYHFNYPERSLTMEEMLNKFIDEGKREHEEMRAFIYDFQTNNELLFKERNNSLIELRFGVQELLNVINNVPTIDCDVKGVTTRGGKATTLDVRDNDTSVPPKEPVVVELEKPAGSNEDLTNDQPQITSKPVVQPSNEVQPPPVPFPKRLRKEKDEAQQKKFLENLKQLHINLPFIEALAQMPKYAKFLKGMLTNKDRLEEACKIIMNKGCFAVLLNKLPSKEKKPKFGRDPKATRNVVWNLRIEDDLTKKPQGDCMTNEEPDSFLSRRQEKSIDQSDSECYESTKKEAKNITSESIGETKMEQLLGKMLEFKGSVHLSIVPGYWMEGFFQIPIALEDQEKTTFTCPYGPFAYQRMPFGLCNAPATFQRCMTAIFYDMVEDFMEVFMDDFSVFEGIVLGHKISGAGIKVDRAKINVIAKLPYPTNVKGFRSFLVHCQILENPDLGTFTEEEITDEFLDEHLMILKVELNNDEPWNKIFEILAHCHSGPTEGHHSASITGRKVYGSGFYWPSIFKDAKDFVMKCDVCQRSRRYHKVDGIKNKHSAAAKYRFMELNELMELRDEAYENIRIYKERIKKWYDSRLRGDKNFQERDKDLMKKFRRILVEDRFMNLEILSVGVLNTSKCCSC
ncbi:DNA-directed DNA polymerase [Tanacetum coccineum]